MPRRKNLRRQVLWSFKKDRHTEALNFAGQFAKVVETELDRYDCFSIYGISSLRVGKLKDAISALEYAITKDGTGSSVVKPEMLCFYLGAAYAFQGRYQKAEEQFDAAARGGIDILYMMQRLMGRGHLKRTQELGEGMDFTKGEETVSVRIEGFTPDGIKVSVRKANDVSFKPLRYNMETEVYPNIAIKAGRVFPSVLMTYCAPGYNMDRFEFETPPYYQSTAMVTEGERLKITNGNTDISIVIGKIQERRAQAIINQVNTELRYFGNALDDSIIIRVAGGRPQKRGRILLKTYTPNDYQVIGRSVRRIE